MNTKATGRMPYPPPNVPTRLNQKLAMLGFDVGSADAVPTRASYEVFDELSQKIDAQFKAFETLVEEEIPELNETRRKLEVTAIVRKSQEEIRELAAAGV